MRGKNRGMVESAEFMRTLDDVVNSSMKINQEFYAIKKFYDSNPRSTSYVSVVDYCLDKYNEGFTKHEALMGAYILMSSGVDMADKFFYDDMLNPYIDNDYLDNYR